MRGERLEMIFRIQIFLQILQLAWAQVPPTAGALPSCTEPLAQLVSASSDVARLEAQLEEARRLMITKQLEVRQCQTTMTTPLLHGKQPDCRPSKKPALRDANDQGGYLACNRI